MKIISNKTFSEINDEKVNKSICTLLRWLVLAFPFVFLMSYFNFSRIEYDELIIMSIIGIAGAVLPSVFLHYKINSSLQKYINLVSIILVVFVVSQETKFEIRLLFVLAVIVSCFYSAPRLTILVAIIGGIAMLISFYLNVGEFEDKTIIQALISNGWSVNNGSILIFEYVIISVVAVVFSNIRKKHLRNEQQLIQDLKEEKERYWVALEGSKDIVYEYDIHKDFIALYGYLSDDSSTKRTPKIIGHFKSYVLQILNLDAVTAEKAIAFLNLQKVEPFELKLFSDEEAFRWFSVTGNVIYEDKEPIKLIGKLHDITEDKENENERLLQLRRDRITKLYNADTAKPMMEEYLFKMSRYELAALYTINIDKFNEILKIYGNMFGYTVMEQVAEVLKDIFGTEDIIFRYEGACFIALAKKISKDDVDRIADEILESAQGIYIGENKNASISFSVGYVTTENSTYLEQLIRWSMKALAAVIIDGGAASKQYNASISGVSDKISKRIISEYSDYAEDDTLYDADKDIITYCFTILERTKDLKSAINILLSRIGKLYKLVSIEIIETDWNLFSLTQIYHWSEEKSNTSEEKKDCSMTKEEFNQWVSEFDDNGLSERNSAFFECINEELRNSIQGSMPSELQCAIYEEGLIKGAIIYSNEDPSYIWPKEQKFMLREITRIMAAHIIKERAVATNKADK